jgi:hypothetical protein
LEQNAGDNSKNFACDCVVVGRIAAAPDVDPVQLLDQSDKAIAKRSRGQLYVPDLCLAAGFQARASVEKRRFDLLTP